MRYQLGLPESCLASAASLYDEAFGQKFRIAIGSEQQRRSLLMDCFKREYAIVAMAGDKLVGIAGFHTTKGSFTGGIVYKNLVSLLGFIKGSRAALILSLYDRRPEKGDMLMDGIAVHQDYRGKGIGRRLLEELAVYAQEKGYNKLRLDVIRAGQNRMVSIFALVIGFQWLYGNGAEDLKSWKQKGSLPKSGNCLFSFGTSIC